MKFVTKMHQPINYQRVFLSFHISQSNDDHGLNGFSHAHCVFLCALFSSYMGSNYFYILNFPMSSERLSDNISSSDENSFN
jgi:hypothetical protein